MATCGRIPQLDLFILFCSENKDIERWFWLQGFLVYPDILCLWPGSPITDIGLLFDIIWNFLLFFKVLNKEKEKDLYIKLRSQEIREVDFSIETQSCKVIYFPFDSFILSFFIFQPIPRERKKLISFFPLAFSFFFFFFKSTQIKNSRFIKMENPISTEDQFLDREKEKLQRGQNKTNLTLS